MTLNVRKAGQGEPVVLIHGLFGSLENLGAVARVLAEDFTVYSLDLPNHGRSSHADSMSLQSMSDEIASWMDQVRLSNAHFFGHSLGGKAAMEVALNDSDRVNKLVVADIAPVKYPPHHNAVFEGLLAVRPEELTSRTEADKILEEHVPEIAVRSFLLKNLVKTPEGFSWRMNLPVIHREYEDLITGNREGSFSGPTLFLKGGNSDYIQEQHREAIVSRFPAVELKVVANTGHWLHAEKPDVVSKIVSRFFKAD